ncbi:MAG TPA: hypothetical protein VJ696_14260, partial [Rhodanobacteraceae bacterium]|nr:hypothetical protein [Rhodanobacteraceae bacterium]
LMQGAAPIAALHDVLARQRAEPCRPIAAESVLEARYPGGLRALAGDWAAFMRNVPATVRTY